MLDLRRAFRLIAFRVIHKWCLDFFSMSYPPRLNFISFLRHDSSEADLDLTPYKGQPSIKQTNHGVWGLSKCFVYLHKRYRKQWIINRSTSSHKVSCNPCVLSELCWLLSLPVPTKQGGIKMWCICLSHGGIPRCCDATRWTSTPQIYFEFLFPSFNPKNVDLLTAPYVVYCRA